jgi:predicted nucleic acid-binding protein
MSAERATYLDSSAIVKLAIDEPESIALRWFLRRRKPLVSSALARTEVGRALQPYGIVAVRRGRDALSRVELVRLSDRILDDAATLPPTELGSLDAIHLATARALGESLGRLVAYDDRLLAAAEALGCPVSSPA